MSSLYYFAHDGSYGQWNGASLLADVNDWDEADWERVENATDSERALIAYEIVMNKIRERNKEHPF